MSGGVLHGAAPAEAPAAPRGGVVAQLLRSILAMMLALTLAGGYATVLLPTGLFPVTQFPRVVVNLDAGARPADAAAKRRLGPQVAPFGAGMEALRILPPTVPRSERSIDSAGSR